ncbi:MAG: hypothetical protein P1R58_03625 [bacterium]|nr:hypothetical protein [bacterium]
MEETCIFLRGALSAMETSPAHISTNSFVSRVQTELQRAERYSIFLSLTVFDLSIIGRGGNSKMSKELERIAKLIRENVRAVDYVAQVRDQLVGLLLPETSRQGAEIVVKRVTELIKSYLENRVDVPKSEFLPLEVASYPDAAGSRSVKEFLQDWVDKNKN